MGRNNATNDYRVLGPYSVGFFSFFDNSENYLGGHYVRPLWSFRLKGVLMYAVKCCDSYGNILEKDNPIWVAPAVQVEYQKRAKKKIRQGMHNNPSSRKYRKPA